eukprot:Skav210462  [mRNA]  locus=scaffold1443:58724:59674:+ [translate_table: standard]
MLRNRTGEGWRKTKQGEAILTSFHALDNFTGKASPQVSTTRNEAALLEGPQVARSKEGTVPSTVIS